MQVLMKEKLLESNYFNNKADSSVIRQALSVNNNTNSSGIISSNNNKLSLHNEKNTPKNKLVALVASTISTNKERKEEVESITVANNVNMGIDDRYDAAGESNSPMSNKIDSLITTATTTTSTKQIKKGNLKKAAQKLNVLEKDAEIFILNQNQTQTLSQNNTISTQIQVYFEDGINNEDSGDDVKELNENNSRDGQKIMSNSQNIKHAGSKSSKVISSNSNKPQIQQQNVKSSKPKKAKKKDKTLIGTEQNMQVTNNDLDAYMQGKTLINSLVRSAINITNQYQNQVKNAENFSPQNSDLVSNSSSNLKMNTNENSTKKIEKSKDKDKKKKSKKSRKKKKSSSSENVNLLNDSPIEQTINIEEIESSEANLKEKERTNISQSFSLSSKRAASAKRHANNSQMQLQNDNQMNFSNNESLRWQNQLDNIDEEQKRIEMYKMNRRKRYIDQRNNQLLAALSKAKSVLSAINTPTNVKIEDHTLENSNNSSHSPTNHQRPSSRHTARNNQNNQNLIIEDFFNSSATASKINLTENSFRPISSRRKITNYNSMNGGDDVNLDYMELSSNIAAASLLPNRPKSEKSFRSSSFVLNNNSSNKRSLIGGETIISSIISNS